MYTTGLSIRRVLDAPIDPLLHHKQPLTSTTTTNPLSSLFPPTSSTTTTARVDLSPVRESTETSSSSEEESGNGRKSKNNDLLPLPLPSSKTVVPAKEPSRSGAFQIFTEDDSSSNNKNENATTNGVSISKPSDDSFITKKRGSSNLSAIPTLASKRPNPSSNTAMNIFTDDDESQSYSITGYSKSTHQVTKAPSISIFTDEDEGRYVNDTAARTDSRNKHSTTTTTASHSASLPSTAITTTRRAHTATVPSTTTTTRGSAPVTQAHDGDSDDAQLQAYLNQLGVLDGEDGTINTRLARRDIDSMFCSPMSADRNDTTARGGGGGGEGVSGMRNDNYDSDLTNEKYTRNNGSMNSPQLLHLPSYAGGSYPSSSAPAGHMGAPRLAFGGGDLSAIQEVSAYMIYHYTIYIHAN